ncbi:hypothetical protein GC176_12940 [bacterium]|nr:hypothetical protein [bacterium]
MIPLMTGEEALRRLFAALTEQTFQTELGVADPALTDYLVDLLVRFARSEAVTGYRDAEGRRLTQVVDMLQEAEHRQAKPRRELLRHIGDYTLFWTGVFPEALPRLQAPDRKDYLISYEQHGRKSYLIASRFEEQPFENEAPVLRRLAEEYDLCRQGLSLVRQEWDRLPAEELTRYGMAEDGSDTD